MLKRFIRKLIPPLLIGWYHFCLALIAAIAYRFPSRQLTVIGVTGTNGKSTTVAMASQILEQAGYKVAYLSSIKFKIGGKEIINDLRMTMPGRFTVQRFFRQAVNSGCRYALLEVTSEGIKQYRDRFISFKTAIFTNLSPEHIEAHGGFENYREAKVSFFRRVKGVHIVNLDDANAKFFLEVPAAKKIGYTMENRTGTEPVVSASKTEGPDLTFIVNGRVFKLNLKGEFNISNALAAISLGLSEGIGLDTCRIGLEKISGMPGRMEEVISMPFKVFVDYAFTPNALKKVYQALRPQTKNLVCVLGSCGGGRDKWKRPVLGSLAAKYCDKVIITNEDPYDEDPQEIIDQVAKGVGSKAEKIVDRKLAINSAIKNAQDNDLIVITGKGCEPSICLKNGERIPWDDRQVVREAFKERNSLDKRELKA